MEPSNSNLSIERANKILNGLKTNEFAQSLSPETQRMVEIALERFSKGETPEMSFHIKFSISCINRELEEIETTLGRERTRISNHVIWEILSDTPAVPGTEEIVVSGQVLSDGRGDWTAIRKIQKTLQKLFPDRTVRIIASSVKKWDKPGALDTSKIEALDLIYYGNNSMGGADVPLSAFPPESNILEKVQKAGVVISAGVAIGTVFESVLDEIQDKSITINEHDTNTSSKTFGRTVLQTGIDPAPDRMGIFTSKEKTYTWDNITNTRLKSVLFGTEKFQDYLSKHECFFGYMHSEDVTLSFIRDAVHFLDTHAPDKSPDVCLPGFYSKGFDGNSYEIEHFLKNSGISQVTSIWFEGDERKEHIQKFEDGNGKELRVIDPGNLSAKDFKRMIHISGPIVGCTGDNSLAETLSAGKIPCYEKRFQKKVAALLNRIKANFGEDSPLYQYCSNSKKGTNARAPELVEQAKQLGQFIREEATFQPLLKGVVNETLLRQKDPDFANREDLLVQTFRDGKISLEELKSQFTSLLSEKGLIH